MEREEMEREGEGEWREGNGREGHGPNTIFAILLRQQCTIAKILHFCILNFAIRYFTKILQNSNYNSNAKIYNVQTIDNSQK